MMGEDLNVWVVFGYGKCGKMEGEWSVVFMEDQYEEAIVEARLLSLIYDWVYVRKDVCRDFRIAEKL